jgi:hypothetical protein
MNGENGDKDDGCVAFFIPPTTLGVWPVDPLDDQHDLNAS